ncbi:MAG: hypothetical protein ACK58L_08590 [Planctomycetota bacterium]
MIKVFLVRPGVPIHRGLAAGPTRKLGPGGVIVGKSLCSELPVVTFSA